MPDQSLLSAHQDALMYELTVEWERARELGFKDSETLRQVAHAADRTLRDGGHWPDVAWVENILMIGGTACAAGVLNHGMYGELKEVSGRLYQEVIDRRWLHGGPLGLLSTQEVEGLGRAVGMWREHTSSAPPAPPSPPTTAPAPPTSRLRGRLAP